MKKRTPSSTNMAMDIVREILWQRSGGRCGLCQEPVALDDLHLDHILPRSQGGSDALDNLQVSHPRCNLTKGNGRRRRMPEPANEPVVAPSPPARRSRGHHEIRPEHLQGVRPEVLDAEGRTVADRLATVLTPADEARWYALLAGLLESSARNIAAQATDKPLD